MVRRDAIDNYLLGRRKESCRETLIDKNRVFVWPEPWSTQLTFTIISSATSNLPGLRIHRNDGMLHQLFCSWALLFTLIVVSSVASDYHERLTLQPLPLGSLLASFDFRSNESLSAFDQQNFRYFPRSLGQILQHTHTKELHLRFTSGRWIPETWGARPWHGAQEGGTGVELWAWIDSASDEE